MTSFPQGWFFIKNLNNGYVLSTEKDAAGEPVVIASVRGKDYDTQLWQHGEDGRLHNKNTGFVLDIFKGLAKAGSEIVQQNDSDSSESQTFGMSSDGHIYLLKDPSLVLGIKESFFTRREGQHVHLQVLDKNVKERKEQRWDFVMPSVKRSPTVNNPIDSLKRTISGASLGSFSSTSVSTPTDGDISLDESAENQLNSFPDSAFFVKSDSTGYFIGVDASSINSPGARLSLEPLRKNNFESQLWHYDVITGRLINTSSGFTLSAEELSDESHIYQSSSVIEKDLALQSWTLTTDGEIKLKTDGNFVLGFKKDSWFGLNREGTNVLLQKQADGKTQPHQRFVVVLPVFRKKTTEIVTITEQVGVFPEDYFFIKNQKHGLVVTVLETDKLAAQVMATKLDSENYNRQLWKFNDGFLVNKASNMALDVRGGSIVSGSEICQYKQKKEGYENQQWGLSVEGYIHAKTSKDIVLALSETKKDSLAVYLASKKTPDHEEQRWNFILPVFKQRSSSIAEATVQKSVSYHQYAQYPSGCFFIRSFIGGSSTDSPLVLTANSATHNISLTKISKEEWRNQLWLYSNGVLINFSTQLAIDVNNGNDGITICQELRQLGAIDQRWYLTIDGYLVHGSNPSLTLVPEAVSNEQYKLVLADHVSVQKEHRWGLLSPEVKAENGVQVLSRWTVTLLTEWKKFNEQSSVQRVVHRIANWPEDTFFITAQDGLALVPEKSEAFAFLVVKKLEYGQSERFKWTYRNGFIVHVATGLVLHASDDLVGGSQLQIREQLLSDDSKTIDHRQEWVVKTDGSIVSEHKTGLGFALLQQDNQYHVQLAYSNIASEHYSWGFIHGYYENRYSDVYKKEVSVIARTERILLTVRTQKTSASASTKLVSHSFGVFPEDWFYIRSKADSTLVITAPNKKDGAKLTLSKIDYKIFRRQLWHVQDDGCLINLESDYVIDVAGGAFNAGSDIIQYHEKYLKKNRKNQVWGLSVDGHLHPKSRPGLVLGAKGNKVFDGAEIQLHTRGSLDLKYQLWSFATPIFGRTISGHAGVSAAGHSESDVYIDGINETSMETSTEGRYELTSKFNRLLRWGVFPEGGFFIRSGYGDARLALTVEKKPRTGENGRTEHEVTLRPINFKEYQWHIWFYKEGHLINAQTGLALDASPTKGLLVENGLHTPLFVRDTSMSENQFWSLTSNGEIYLRSDERKVIGVSNAKRVSIAGAQVGLRELSVRTFMNENNQQETSLNSEEWLRWVFSKPVYGSKTISSTTTISTSVSQESSAGEIIEGFSDEVIRVEQKEESSEGYSAEVDDDEFDDEHEEQQSSSTSTGVLGKIGIATTAGVGIVTTAGVGIITGAAGVFSNVFGASSSASTAIAGKKQEKEKSSSSTSQSQTEKKTSYESLRYDFRDSYHASSDYVPTGLEKVVRYKTHQKPNFPSTGYFLIKSNLHGFVLDVAGGDTKDGAFVVLSAIKSTNFASQLWFYQDGRVVNLKGHNLVLDATMTDTVTAGERLVISTKTTASNTSDQHWELDTDSGLIYLKNKRNLVISVKDVKRVTDQSASIDVYIQEQKSHLRRNIVYPEQRWEIKIPALIPIGQSSNTTSEYGYSIIEGGKVGAISSSASAIIAFEFLKETFHHKITSDNQWPSSHNWFFIRVGSDNSFLSSGVNDASEVKFVTLGQREDHKRFLWAYVDGYLVNYKYMLRLVFDKQANKLLLSNKSDTLNQVFSVSSQGNLSVTTSSSETIYFRVASRKTDIHAYDLISSAEAQKSEGKNSLQLHIPIFSDVEVEKDSKVALSTVISWVQSSQKTSSTTITSSSTTTTSKVVQHYGVFPNATWFFVKADAKDGDSLVLAVKNDSRKSGTTLVLKKLSFKDYKSQLWTFRDGLLINYGSKLVIDVSGEINNASKLIQSSEAGVGTQKWSLTANGRIHLDSYSRYTIGYRKTDRLVEETEVVLVTAKESYEESDTIEALKWRFSVPVFGNKTDTVTSGTTIATTSTTTASSIERLSASIEQGALIESVEEAEIKVEDTFVKKSNAANTTASSVSTAVVEKEKHHGFHDVLTSVGIAVTAGALGVAAVEGASKIASKISEHSEESKKAAEEKKQSSTATIVQQQKQKQEQSSSSSISTATKGSTTSAVTDVDKTTETVTVYRSQRTSVQIIEESRVIVRAWKIVFSQRVRHCKTKAELVQTIEESREDLFRRLDEHLRVHASVEHLVAGAVPEWHVSIHQVKEIYRARVFEKFLDLLSKKEISNVADLDFDKTLSSATEEVESHYRLVVESQTKVLSESSSSTQVTESQCSEVSIQENVLVTIDTIKVTVRYWLIGLYETISIARQKGSSEEEIKVIIDNSRKELTTELASIKTSASSHIEKSSSSTLATKQTSIKKTIETAVAQAETVVTKQVDTIYSEKAYAVSEEHWLDVTRVTEERLSSELKVYQTAITQEISEVQNTEISKSDKAEISIVLDEKMVAVAQQTVTNKLVETKTKLSSWFIEVSQQISWVLEESKTSASQETIKQDTIAIVDAAQIEVATRIEETKLVLRAYYAHLTYLSWAERRRIEYSLDNIKASITASVSQFKKSIEKSDVTQEQIIRYSSYSFGATASRLVLTDLQSIVHKVTNVKETTTAVNTTDEVKAEKAKIAAVGKVTSDTKAVEFKKTSQSFETIQSKQEVIVAKKTEVTKVDEVKKTEKVNFEDKAKIVDIVQTEVEDTKVGKVVDNKASTSTSKVGSSSSTSGGIRHTAATVSKAALGAAAAAMASAAIFHHYEGKETQQKQQEQKQQETTTTNVAINAPVVREKSAITHTNVIVGNKTSETIHADEQKTSTTTVTTSKQEKAETLVVVYDQVQVVVSEWLTNLNKRVYECAQKKGSNAQEEIDAIVYESQHQLVVEIEKAKRNTTTVIGTSQTSFHDTLSLVRSTAFKQAVEVKRIGYEVASSNETSTTDFKQRLESLKETTLHKVTSEIEKSKTSASVIHIVGHESSAVIAAGKKFEGKDYSKTSCGKSVENTKVSVGILIENTRVTVQHLFNKLTTSITERRKQGGDNVQADIDVIIKKSRDEINSYVLKSKTEFESRITSVQQVSSSTEISTSNNVEVELTNETIKKVQSTLEQVQESYLVQVSRVEEVNTSTTITSETEYTERLAVISQETHEKLNATLSVSEMIIGHHIEVVAESSSVEQSSSSSSTTVSKTEEISSSSNSKVSLGVEYGLLVVAETTKSVSSQISALVEQVHHRVTIGSQTLDQDVVKYVEASDKEVDLIFDQAKAKISYELSMVASHEKVEEEHFLASLESLRTSTKQRITQIKTVATVHKEESKIVSEKLLQIAEESRHEVSSHYESVKQSVTKQSEKVSQVAHNSGSSHEAIVSTQVIASHSKEEKKKQEQKEQEEHQSHVDLAKKVLIGSAAVAAGTAIAVEIAKKLTEHKEKTDKIEHTEKQTAVVVEDVQVQYNKWISSLTETVIAQSKQSTLSTEEINVTVKKSKAEFIEIIKKAKSSDVVTKKHQQQILSWIEETAIAQASRIQEIAVSSSSSAAIDIESRLEVLKLSTTQEIEVALEKCKQSKSSSTDFVGVSVQHLQQKEAALLDVRSELVIVIQDVKSSLVTYFQSFTKSLVTRIQQGGDNVEKDVAILISNTRKDLSVYVENVKNTATKRLSALETKSSNSVISTAALSGIATAEIISVLKASEETIIQKVNHVHSSVWYMEKNQDTTEIIQSITKIESETTVEITEKVESSKYGFATAINEHHKSGHVTTEVTKVIEQKDVHHLEASLSVQEIKVTIREWLRNVAEKVSVCSQKGGSAEEIDIIIKRENDIIYEYLDLSVTKISQTVKSEESIKHLHSTIKQVKASISKTSTEIKVIGVESSSKTSSYGGFDKMTSVITEHEQQISQSLVVYESKISSSSTEKKQTTTVVADKTASSVSSKKNQQQKQVMKQDVYTVVTTEYILSTVHNWLEELVIDVSEIAKREHNVTIVTKEINSVITDAKEYIAIEFETISTKIRASKGEAAAVQGLVNILEWTRGMVLQSSAQIQQIGINCAVSFSSTGGIEQMRPLVSATENQIIVAVGRCNKTIKIDVERNSAHSEKHKAKKDCKEQERNKRIEYKKPQVIGKNKKSFSSDSDSDSEHDSNSDSDSASDRKGKKAQNVSDKKAKRSKAHYERKGRKPRNAAADSDIESDSASESEKDSDIKKRKVIDKKKVAAGVIIGGAILKGSLDSDSSSSQSDSDSENKSKKRTAAVDKKKLSTGQSTLDVTIIVREWYEKLITDVSQRAKKGGSTASSDIEVLVQKATANITETLRIISVNAHKSVTDTTTVQQYRASIEWTKNLVIQSSYQIKAIGINSAASSSSKTGGIEQMRPIAVAIQEQIDVEIRRYKLVVEKTQQSSEKKTINAAVTVVEHKQNNECVNTGRKAACNRKEYCGKLEQHVSEVVSESKVVIISWFSQLVRDISLCVHEGGPNVNQNVSALIAKSKLDLESNISRTQYKFTSSIDVFEKDKTFALIQSQINESLKVVRSTVDTKVVEIQEIAIKYHSESEINEKLSVVLESSRVQISETLDAGCRQSITVIQQETIQTESTVRIIDNVESVKTVVSNWQTKLTEQIQSISTDNAINNKEERIDLLIKQATEDVERVTREAKVNVSQDCSSVKKINKSKEQELIRTIELVRETFTADAKKIQDVSVEAIQKSDTTHVKESVASVVHSSREKIDSFLTRATASVVGVATAAIAVHAVSKQEKQEEKKIDKSSHNEWSVDVKDNVGVMSQWFKLFTEKISDSVHHRERDTVQDITVMSEHAEQEISQIITTARTDFIKRLSHESLDQESYHIAVQHYEESLENVRVSIISQIDEAKKVAIHAHTTGNTQQLESELTKISVTSTEKIKVAMGSSVVITHKAQGAVTSNTNASGSVLNIEVMDDDLVVLNEEDIDFERKEHSVATHEVQKLEQKKAERDSKHGISKEKIIGGALAVGAIAAGAALLVHHKNEKEEVLEKQKKQQHQSIISAHQHLKYDSGVTTVDSVKILISAWFTSLIQKVSTASKAGASSQQITVIVEESRQELTQIIDHAKTSGSSFCSSANDEQQYVSKIEWASSVAHNQAVQIQQIGINAAAGRTDLTSQMEALSTASYHQIEVTLDQLKTSVTFHQKVNKINSSKTTTEVGTSKTTVSDKPVCGKMETTVDKTKVAYSVIQETRATTLALFVGLSERIVSRIREGGANAQQDVSKMIESTEKEVIKVFNEAKSTSSKIDKKTRIEITEALSTAQKTVQEQIIQVKTVSVQAVSINETDSKVAIEKVLEVSKSSQSKIETTFTTVSTAITASLVVVSQTAQKATESVQGWFGDLTTKINKLLEADDCSEEETQVKINTLVAEAEVEMNNKITKLQESSTTAQKTSSSKTTQVSTDHHLDVFFGNIKSSVQNQLKAVRSTVKDAAKSDKETVISKLHTTESQLKEEVGTHYEAVDRITTVQHITGTEQTAAIGVVESHKDSSNRHENYKNTIEKVAIGTAAVAAAAAAAISYHKKNQQSQTTAVQVVKKSSIQDVQVKIDTWFTHLTEKVTARTKQGGSNVSADVQKIVEQAQSELEVTINEAKSQHSSSTTTESKRTFSNTLEWIKTTAYTQSSQITQVVKQSSSSSVDLTTQIENHVSAMKHQVDSALEVHYKTESSTTVEQKASESTISAVKKETVSENVVQVVTETREQTQKRFSLETTVIVQESKTQATNWLVLLLENVTSIIHGNSETIRKDIFSRLAAAEKEADVYIQETKQKFLAISKTSAASHVESSTQTLIVNSVKQSLDCIDSIRSTLLLQIAVLREVITRIEVEDIDIITERLEAVINRTQKRVHHTLEVGIHLAISSAFEGKVVTWTETTAVPASFKQVRAVAFDVVGAVANYRKTLNQVWKQIVTPKNDVVLRGSDFNVLVDEWYAAYTEIKRDNFSKNRPVSDDDSSLHEALVQILKRYNLKELLSEPEIEQLCAAWRSIGVYDDASLGIRRLKNQESAKYAAVAISDTFSTSSMIELAQNNGLCWHAQFSADMFASQQQASSTTTTASQSVVKGTIQLLGLERANQLAVVSSSAEMLAAAKKQGCHTVLIEREEFTSYDRQQQTIAEYDIKVDGLDIFGESVQSFLEHETMVQVWNEKEAPSAPRVLVQKLRNIF